MAIITGSDGVTILEVDSVTKAMRAEEYLYWDKIRERSADYLKSYIAVTTTPFLPGTQAAFTITGAANTLVRVLRMGISQLQTTAGVNNWFLWRYSSALTGGTAATLTNVPLDDNDSASNAIVQQWTVNFTGGGASVGALWGGRLAAPAAATAGAAGYQGLVVDFTQLYGKPALLRGANQVIGWTSNGVAVAAGTLLIPWVQWTEETL
jgi:hypothetical protein